MRILARANAPGALTLTLVAERLCLRHPIPSIVGMPADSSDPHASWPTFEDDGPDTLYSPPTPPSPMLQPEESFGPADTPTVVEHHDHDPARDNTWTPLQPSCLAERVVAGRFETDGALDIRGWSFQFLSVRPHLSYP